MALKPTRRGRARATYTNMLTWSTRIFIFAAFAWFFYQVGAERGRATSEQLVEKLEGVTDEKLVLEEQNRNLQALLVREQELAKQLNRNLEETIPPGDARDIFRHVQKQLNAGVDPDRLEHLVSQAGARLYCNSVITSQGHIHLSDSDSAAKIKRFANGTISLALIADRDSRDGTNAAPPLSARRIMARFAVIGGDQVVASGGLPIDKTIALGLDDYRFRISAQSGKTVKILTQICSSDKQRYEERKQLEQQN